MGVIRNGLDGGVSQQGGIIITKSGESSGVVGAPTAPANVQIVDKAPRGPKVCSLKRRKNTYVWKMEPGYASIKFSDVHQRPRGIRASSSAPPYFFWR